MTAAEPSTAMATVYSEHVDELVVAGRDEVADGVVGVVLEHPEGAELPAWTPGAHVDLLLAPDLVRQYSLCGSPADRSRWRLGVLLDPGGRGGSRHVHEQLQVGSRLRVRGPRNHFPLVSAQSYVFVAGGIGITPILPMIAEAEGAGADWTLVYGGRRRGSMAFVDELARYGDRVVLRPEDEYGLLDLPAVLAPRPGTVVYACGPEALLQAVEQQCASWPPGSLHVERFAARPVEAGAESTSFEVVCQRSGITVTVPADRSILEVVQEAGVSALSSCLEGVCGTCETPVVEGTPDHRDSLLSDEEKEAGDYMMICVSRSRSPRLVLDV
ncbi:PDR/VanB family oxidoreductase [Trujillonella humicola]|uniref:PDR/VanB family oxidoreductase n=1 Tax=Trujillonella humicola TaxID=3383699 RepID=UPI0039059319